ncbi:uncharacterized protein Obp22a [Periplaneta americana]|uniref:uncharacterized protein Obp22a n=1 Tax=Periplaneta americana TaxID=6978 RepID=UPI0037E8A87B
MKGPLILSAVLAATLTYLVSCEKVTDEEMVKILRECIRITNVKSPDELRCFHNREDPKTRSAKCFIGCLLERLGLLIECEFNEDNCRRFVVKTGGKEKYGTQLYNMCKESVGDGDDCCDTGPKVWKCIIDIDESTGRPI